MGGKWHTQSMPKPIKQTNRPKDVNQWARQMVEESTQEPTPESAETINVSTSPTAAQISAFMAEMGRKGGKIGGKHRAANMTPEQRSDSASKAARKRWGKEETSSVVPPPEGSTTYPHS
jgi:hypothetical protein